MNRRQIYFFCDVCGTDIHDAQIQVIENSFDLSMTFRIYCHGDKAEGTLTDESRTYADKIVARPFLAKPSLPA